MQIDKVVLAAHALHTSPGTYAVLLGSGLSSAAGIRTGWGITLDLARCVAAVDGDDPDDPEGWYRSRYGVAPDYSVLLETLGPTPSERREILRRYIEPTPEDLARGRRVPTDAHRAVARLAASGHIRVILTTNFDRLIETALTSAGVSHDVIATEDALAGARPIGQAPCVVVKLHGDYQDSRIRNTEKELGEYSKAFNDLLDRVLDEYGLIICGWSATWDHALRKAIARQPNRRYTTWWVDIDNLSSEAAALAQARRATVIEGTDADTFFGDLSSKVAALTEADRPHPVSVAVAVAELKQLLPDPAQRIRVHDLVCVEARRVRSACNDPTTFPLDLPTNRPSLDREMMQARVNAYEGQTELLEGLFAVGCGWDTDPILFVEALKVTADISPMAGGNEYLLYLRRYPALRCLYAGGIAAVYQQRWDTLRALTLDATAPATDIITDGPFGPLPMAAALDYWSIFGNDRETARLLPGQSRSSVPVSDYLLKSLQTALRGTVPVDHEYQEAFDRFEYMLGLIIEDALNQRPEGIWSSGPVGNFNRNRYATVRRPHIWDRIRTEANQAGADWGPIRAGIFGGSTERFAEAEKKYRSHVLTALQERN